jgi:hypothetical protein
MQEKHQKKGEENPRLEIKSLIFSWFLSPYN